MRTNPVIQIPRQILTLFFGSEAGVEEEATERDGRMRARTGQKGVFYEIVMLL
jgi:hypothetical protein